MYTHDLVRHRKNPKSALGFSKFMQDTDFFTFSFFIFLNNMTQGRIPTELLLHITQYLTPDEKKEGLLICKQWYEVFRFGLYNTIYIENVYQLKQLFSSLVCSNQETYSHRSSLIPNGHVVRALFIYNRSYSQKPKESAIILPKVLFEQLPYLCPNLEQLDFEPETWKHVHFHPNVLHWKSMLQLPTLATMGSLSFIRYLGHGITSLSIQSEMIVDISTTQKLYCILSLVPNIRDFSILGSKATISLILTVEDIEVIHTLLPCLESFSILGDNIQMLEPSSSIENFPTAPCIKSLHWNTISIPVGWLLYVAHKYSSVRYLTLAIQHSYALERQEHMMYYTERLVRTCRQLEKFSFSSCDLSDWFHPPFLDLLLTHCTRMNNVCPILNKDNQIRYDSQLNIALQVKHVITALEIEQWRLDSRLSSTIQTLTNFIKLSHLELKCDSYHNTYDMDMLLDACPVLDSLVLIWGTLSVKENTRRCHPLRSLQLTFVAFYQHTFQYLTQRCRSLSTLHITRCKQICEMKNISTQTVMKLDMPHNSFYTIVLDGVRLDYSVESIFGSSSYIRVLCVNNKWYLHVAYNNGRSPVIYLLDDKDSEIVKNYFTKREQCTFVNSNHRLSETLSEQKLLLTSLKTNSMFGFVEIKCKHVKHFSLDGHFVS